MYYEDITPNHPYIEEIQSMAYSAGYDAELTDTGIEFTYIGNRNAEFAPILTAPMQYDAQDNVYYFYPSLSMPECNSEDLELSSTFETLGRLYMEVAKIATYLADYPLDLNIEWAD